MRVFFSHVSKNKQTLEAIRDRMPEHIKVWLDATGIKASDNLWDVITREIKFNTDYFVVFIDDLAKTSGAVQREIRLALEREEELGRQFLIPVVLPGYSIRDFEPNNLGDRLYLSLPNFKDSGIEYLAEELSENLFALLDDEYQRVSQPASAPPPPTIDPIAEADRIMNAVADVVRRQISNTNAEEPMSVSELIASIPSTAAVTGFQWNDLPAMLDRLQQNGRLNGIYFDGYILFNEEDPIRVKERIELAAKERIASRAASLIRSGNVVALDGGSTTKLIARLIGRGLITHRITNITVITNSVTAATELIAAATAAGIDKDHGRLRLLLAGGRVRPNTEAVVSLDKEDEGSAIRQIVETEGHVDLTFVGTTGITKDGFTTRSREEMSTKRALMVAGARQYIVTDPSKFGRKHDYQFSPIDGVSIITTREAAYDATLQWYEPLIAEAGGTIIFA